ncbi:spermatogenesis-associated protein 7 homolog [Rattus norvegicus]|uniref:spermatogenesis-associated protein 7 homolog n=3 Tax=Rattus norvegicus TaxID=10116 RepID=UPI0000DBFB9F|nr:spermatogenesis-associated protein 7 homolog [Rattus norvegicus]|eukprot:NP_620217.2 spermatogenesis-associated protein 7 homolog [Rattus norvegicus]
MDGSRRVRATTVLPRYSPPCLFTGHLSTKSNAFCTDSSSLRLTTLQLIKNHMAVHYNKILSAKAAVDCSIPVSVNASIKYADQQRREKLRKELARCEKEFKLSKSAMQTNSKMNSKFFVNSLQRPSGEPQDQDVLIEERLTRYPSFSKSLIPSPEGLHLSLPESNKILMNGTQKYPSTAPPRYSGCGHGYDRRPRSAHQFQVVISKTPSGDLLEKHADLFSNNQSPFTPRTLKTEAKSFLSQYRYYTPAKRRRDFSDQRMEAETQTELSSFNSELGTAEKKSSKDSDMSIKQAPNYMRNGAEDKIAPLSLQGQNLAWDKSKDGILQPSSERAPCTQFSPDSKIYSDEEELLYLSFMENVTDEILKLGLFSNRFLERLFERHIRKNKHHLEEGKMRYLLHGLKVDLGCISEEEQNSFRIFNEFHFQKALTSRENRFINDTEAVNHHERQQYQEALNMLSSVPKDENKMFSFPGEFLLPAHKVKHSEGVIVQQVNDETDFEALPWDGNNPSVSDSFIDQETSVDVIEGDSDFEMVETSRELCCLSTSLSPSVPLPSIEGGSNHDKELSTLKIMEMSIED